MSSSKDKPLSKTPRKRTTERMREDGLFSHRTKQRKRHIMMVKKIIGDFGGKATREKIIKMYENTPNVDRQWSLNKGTGKQGSEKKDNKVFAAQIELWTVNSDKRLDGHGENSKPRCPRGYNSDYDVLFQTKEGDLELYEYDTHGAWTIIEGEDGELEIANDRDASSADSETIFNFERLKNAIEKISPYHHSYRNYLYVTIRTLLYSDNKFTAEWKEVEENIAKLNFGAPPKSSYQSYQGWGAAKESCLERGSNVGIKCRNENGEAINTFTLQLTKDTTKKEIDALKAVCGEAIARLHVRSNGGE